MKNIIILLFVFSIFACNKEKDAISDLEIRDSITLRKGKNNPAPPVTPSIIESNVDNLNFCGNQCLVDLNEMVNTSSWGVFNPDELGYIDYELEEAFLCSSCYSGCTIKVANPPISTPVIEFVLVDEGYVIYGPTGDVIEYEYLSDAILPSKAEEIKDHFACEIRNFQETYYSDYFSFVSDIDFFGDALLCTCPSGQLHFLKAKVTFSLHQ